MKRLSFLLFLLISIVGLFCACGSDNNSGMEDIPSNLSNPIVGRWHLVKTVQEFVKNSPYMPGQSITIDAKNLGTYWDISETSVTIHSPQDREQDGKTYSYRLNGNIATVSGGIQYEVISVSAHEMVLRSEEQGGYVILNTYWEK